MRPRGHVIDLRPLQTSRSFREIWGASVLTGLAGQIAAVAALAQIWTLTHSAVWTGAMGLAQGIPLLVIGAVGGSLADRYDRRPVVAISTAGQSVAACALTAQAAVGNRSPWLVLTAVAVLSAAGALGAPARKTLPARLLPREQVAAGIALQNLAFQGAMLAGPALGGLLVVFALPAAYACQALLTPFALLAALRLPALPPDRSARVAPGGWTFALRKPAVRGAMLTDLATTTLSMPIAVFPMINALRFDGDPRALGAFLSAIALGGIAAGLVSGTVTRLPRPGLVQLVCAGIWGAALVGFGLSSAMVLAVACLVLAGAADTIGVVTRGGLIHLATPDRYRGRVCAIDHVIGVAGPEIGNLRGGVLATLVGAPAALAVGGACAILAAVAVGAAHPALRSYRPAGTGETTQASRA